ncbi:MAG: tetratricopeptide repeat protein [candidate division Zixibacteria bacterium]|nr:tetratricopeptide repeat protein [candidate division Zixibacteria bacterium]
MSGTRVVLAFVVAAGVATAFYRLGAHSLWFDEITGARVADQRTAAEVVSARKMDSHPPAMALAEHWSRKEFGLSEWSLRLPAALASALALIFVVALAAAWGDLRVGLLAGALAAFSPTFVFFAHNARPYAMAMFFAGAASACFLFAFQNRRKYLWFPLYAVLAGLALYTHYFTTVVLTAHFFVGLLGWLPGLRPRRASSSRSYAIIFVLLVAAIAAAAAAAWPIFGKALNDRERFPGGEMAVTPNLVFGAFASVGWNRAAANVLFLAAWVAGIASIWRRVGKFGGATAFFLTALPIFLPVAIIRFTTQYWNPRFCYFAFPAFMAVAAFGFVAMGKVLAGAARRSFPAAALTVVLSAGIVKAVADDVVALRVGFTTPVQDFRGAVAFVNRNRNWQAKVMVWPFRNWDCYHFYTKTQGGPDALARPRRRIIESLETWPRVFVVSTDAEFNNELTERFASTVRFRFESLDILYYNALYETPGKLFERLPRDVVGVAPAILMNALGRHAVRAELNDAAKYYFEAAVSREGLEKAETFVLADLYAARGEYERALRLAGGYVRRHPDEGWPYTKLADIYSQKGDKNSAIAYYRRAVWLEPSKDNWRKRLKDLAINRPFFRGLLGYSDPRWI